MDKRQDLGIAYRKQSGKPEEAVDKLKNGEVFKKETHKDRSYILNDNKEIVVKSNWNNKPRNWVVSAYNLKKETPSQALPEFRALNQTSANGQQISPLDSTKVPENIIPDKQSSLKSIEDWLKEVKRKRGHK